MMKTYFGQTFRLFVVFSDFLARFLSTFLARFLTRADVGKFVGEVFDSCGKQTLAKHQ